MRIWKTIALAGAALMVTSAVSMGQDGPTDGQLVEVATEEIFVPFGFDDNDEVVVVIDGFLPSSCYRLTRPEVTLDHDTGVVKVAAVARFFDSPCIAALVPFSQDVTIGMLPMGDYQIRANAGELQRPLVVAEANNSGPDDYLYAPVDAVHVDENPEGGLVAVVEGRFTNSCMSFAELRLLDQRQQKTLALLPIMEVADGADCQAEERTFKEVVELPLDLEDPRYLLHVRSLNGKAVNLLFSNPHH